MGDRGRDFGSDPCPACDAEAVDGDLCMTHRALLERGVPKALVKRAPPKVEQLRFDIEGFDD